jgi:hypothetical protein
MKRTLTHGQQEFDDNVDNRYKVDELISRVAMLEDKLQSSHKRLFDFKRKELSALYYVFYETDYRSSETKKMWRFEYETMVPFINIDEVCKKIDDINTSSCSLMAWLYVTYDDEQKIVVYAQNMENVFENTEPTNPPSFTSATKMEYNAFEELVNHSIHSFCIKRAIDKIVKNMRDKMDPVNDDLASILELLSI